MPDHSQAIITVRTTPRGFERGAFLDCCGEPSSIQESSAATFGAIWLGIDKSRDQTLTGPSRMHLRREDLAPFIPQLQKFVETGEGPKEPVLFLDGYGVPCTLSSAPEGRVRLGVVLPCHANGNRRIFHDTNMYAAPSSEMQDAIATMFQCWKNGDTRYLEICNRMLLNRAHAATLFPLIERLLTACEARVTPTENGLDQESFPGRY